MDAGKAGTVERYRRVREIHQHVSKRVRAKVKKAIRREFLRIYSQLSIQKAMRLYRAEWHRYPA